MVNLQHMLRRSHTILAAASLFQTLTIAFPAISYGAATTDTENYLRVIWGLCIVLGIIFLLYGLLRKRFSLLSTDKSESIKVIEIKPLMGKKALCLVEVKGHELLLGLSADSISHLATLSGEKGTSFASRLKTSKETYDNDSKIPM